MQIRCTKKYHLEPLRIAIITMSTNTKCFRWCGKKRNLLLIIIFFNLRWVFIAACGFSLAAASGGYSSLWYKAFSLRWLLLLWSTGSRHTGFSSCGSWALECRLSSCGARAYLFCDMWGLPGPGLEPVTPEMAGRFLTTAPPILCYWWQCQLVIATMEHRMEVTRVRGGGKDKLEIGIDIYTPLYIKEKTNKGLLYSTGNSTQYSVMTCMGKESKKDWIYV